MHGSSFYGASSNGANAMESMRQMQILQSQQEMMMRREQERIHSETVVFSQIQNEIRDSKTETDRLRSVLVEIGREGGPVAQMSNEYRSYRSLMEERQEVYRRMWMEEESRVKLISEETKKKLKIVRDHLIGTLDHVDVSNRAMMESMDSLLRVDLEMRNAYGDPIPHTMSYMAPSSPATTAMRTVPVTPVAVARVTEMAGQGISISGT